MYLQSGKDGWRVFAADYGRPCKIFAPVEVCGVDEVRGSLSVCTRSGFCVRSKIVIFASGYEMPDFANKRKNKVCYSFAIATEPQPESAWPGDALIWEASDPYLYLRTTKDGCIICGGGDEELRDAFLPQKIKYLEKKLAKLFPEAQAAAEYAWCGSFGTNSTGLPTIGPVPGKKNCFLILAFGGNGITFSRLATELIAARLGGHPDTDEELFAP